MMNIDFSKKEKKKRRNRRNGHIEVEDERYGRKKEKELIINTRRALTIRSRLEV